MKPEKKSFDTRRLIAAAMTLALTLSACGTGAPASTLDAPAPDSTENTNQSQPESTQKDGVDTANENVPEGPASKLAGKWVFIYSMYHSESNDGGEYTGCTMSTDDYAPESKVSITEKDGKMFIDYRYGVYESIQRLYGNELQLQSGAAYEGCPNNEWYCTLTNPDPEDEDSIFDTRITLTDDDKLILSQKYESSDEFEDGYWSLTTDFYLRADSPLLADMEALRYFDTVTVDNPTDLLNSIQNNRKILLKPGIYNLSTVPSTKIKNGNVNESYGEISVQEVRNLCLEPESAGEIFLCVNDVYNPVLAFKNGGNITLRGITAGHDVEPGYCSGSVLRFDSIDGITVDGCKLFGCGTYGIEAESSYSAEVTDTEIYECTYGLLDLRNSSSFHFKNCVMRDSKDMSMICLHSSYDTTFEDCTFKNNNAMAYDSCSFVELGDYDTATFRGCTFENNDFYTFSNKEVTLENCKSDNNHAGFNALLNQNPPVTKDDLLTMYEENNNKQEEIDKKFTSDALMDQATLNQTAQDSYEMWDGLLNKIWSWLGEQLGEEEMTALTEEQRKWIKDKEAQVKTAAADFEGGSMKPMIEYSTGATLTQKRVAYLIENYVRKLGEG
ncbi:MAG: lysozyme inhibitor LprI family protein [Lachnospiraceae bacterium]|nr:lysozyme inhibitor LprI family protein [Lachnospiraceae bacterium]